MDQAIDLLPADYWRYYLMANAPETSDSSFMWEHFAATVNKDLADTFGNFVNRAFKLTEKHFGSVVPEGGAAEYDAQLEADVLRLAAEYSGFLADKEFRKAMQTLKALWTAGNMYFDRMQPWQTIKTDKAETARTLRTAINLVRVFALLAWPVIPSASETVFGSLGLAATERGWIHDAADLWRIESGRAFTTPPPLFQKITDDQTEEWEIRFGGADQ